MSGYTERGMLDMLRQRHASQSGNGPEWAYMEHVRDAAGFAAKRTADALALHLWPSRGHELHGYEVKVSRGDWLRELKEPEKAEGWCTVVDRWWIVAPKGVVKDDLPSSWGLLEPRKKGDGEVLHVTVPAPVLRPVADRTPITRSLLVPMLRAAGAALAMTPNDKAIADAKEQGRAEGRAAAEKDRAHGRDWRSLYEQESERARGLRETLREIETASGGGLGLWTDPARAREVGAAVRTVLRGDQAVQQARAQVERAVKTLTDSAEHMQRTILDGRPY